MAADNRRNINRNVESLELTDEERKVLRECRRNSMIRGVPAGILSAILTSFAVRSGKFPHLTHWSRFYYGVSFTGGLLVGVASYRKTCLEKIMKLENSVLAEQVREYYRSAGIEYTNPFGQRKDSEFDESPANAYSATHDHGTEFSEENVTSSLRLHQEENNPSINRQRPEERKNTLSFEERRKQHRQQWNMDQYPHPARSKRNVDDQIRQSHGSDHDIPSTSSIPTQDSQGSRGPIKKNIYGDPIE